MKGITWETSAGTVEYVERAVSRKLAAIGEARGLPPSVAIRIAGRLFKEIWKTLRKPTDRFLDRLHLAQLWEEETHISVPYQTLLRELATKTPSFHAWFNPHGQDNSGQTGRSKRCRPLALVVGWPFTRAGHRSRVA